MPRGGYRPTAPQNNPNNINPMGGNGQSGRDYTGFAYGENKAIAEQQASAPMAQANKPSMPSKTAINQAAMQGGQQGMPMQQPSLVPLNAPTQRPNEPITTGLSMGPGAGPSILGLPQGMQAQQGQSAKQLVQSLASRSDASPELQRLAQALGQ